jgi:hypothetical protein
VLVKEPWAPELDVKADEARPDGFDVLKLNHIRDVPTGIYTYHQMASVFFRRDSGALRKVAAMSSEACGLTTALVREGRLETRSYWDGEGDRSSSYPSGALPEDGLPALLRDYVEGALPEILSIFPTFLSPRAPRPEARTFRLARRDAGAVNVAGGNFDGVELRLDADGVFLSYTFDRSRPHVLLAFSDSDGTTYTLSKVERLAYWSRKSPEHAGWLPPEVR